jgi:hypothetical protein
MRAGPAGRLPIIVIRAICSVVVWAVIAPGAAEASCSHYVRSGSAPSRSEWDLIDFGQSGLANQTTRAWAPPAPSPRVPCSGALCSGQPASPSVPTDIDHPLDSQQAILLIASRPDGSGPGFSLHDETVLVPRDRRTSVDHPPRPWRSRRAL